MRSTTSNVRRSGALLGAVMSIVLVSACSTDPEKEAMRFTEKPEISAEGKSVYFYDNLSEMADASAYIVRGKVLSAGPGRSVGTPGADLLTYRDVIIELLEVVKGSATVGDRLQFEEEGYETDGTGYVMNGAQWSLPGDEAWYFLREDPEGILHLASSRGRFGITGSDTGPSGFDLPDHNPWEGIPNADVAKMVRDAARRSRP